MTGSKQENQANWQTLFVHFSQYLQQYGADEQAYDLYRTQVRAALHAMPADQALARIVTLELMLPQTESKLCAAMRLDEGLLHMAGGQLAHALTALKDACAMSAKCRDSEGMVECSLALAKCFSCLNDTASAIHSAQLSMRVIATHFAGEHPLRGQAQAYLEGDFSDEEQSRLVKEDAAQEQDETDFSLQEPSFVRSETSAQKTETDAADSANVRSDGVVPSSKEDTPQKVNEMPPVLENKKQPLQLETAEGNLYLEDAKLTVGFSKKDERITGSSQRRRNVQTSLLVGAKNGLLVQGTTYDAALQQQISHWMEQGRYDEAFEFLSKLEQALPKDSEYHIQVTIWTAQLLSASGDETRAIGLYSRLVEQILKSDSLVAETHVAIMQQLCQLYHDAGQLQREHSLRRLTFRAVTQQNAREDLVLDVGEAYMQCLLDVKDAKELEAMCRWYAGQEGDPQLFDECVDALLPLLDEAQDDETACGICAIALEYCQKHDWPLKESWISAWMFAVLNVGDLCTFLQLAQRFETELCKDSMFAVRDTVQQCAAQLAADGNYDLAVEFYSLCLQMHVVRNDGAAEEQIALQLASALENCGRGAEAADIRKMYLPTEESVPEESEDVQAQTIPEAENTFAADAELKQEKAEQTEHVSMDSLRQKAEQCEKDGDVQAAKQLRARIYQLRKQSLGDLHPDTLAALNNYAKALSAAGDMREAAIHQLSAVNGYAKIMGRDHAYTLTAMNNFAKTLERADKYAEALKVRETIYHIYSEKLPQDHADVQRARKRMLRARKLAAKV